MGLRPREALARSVPWRKMSSDIKEQVFPADHIYIGPGHFSQRWPVGPWTNHFRAGQNGTSIEIVPHYMQWLHTPSIYSLVYTYSRARSWFVIVHISTMSWWCFGCPCLVFSVFFHIQPCWWQTFPVDFGSSTVLVVSAASLSFKKLWSLRSSRCVVWSLEHTFSSLYGSGSPSRRVISTIFDLGFVNIVLQTGLPTGPRMVSLAAESNFSMSCGVQTGADASGTAAPPLVLYTSPTTRSRFASVHILNCVRVMFWLPFFGLQRLLLHPTVLVADLLGGLWQQQAVLVWFLKKLWSLCSSHCLVWSLGHTSSSLW